MKFNLTYLVGAATTIGVVSFAIYAIRASKIKKREEEYAISVEQARKEVEERLRTTGFKHISEEDAEKYCEEHEKKVEEFRNSIHDEVSWNMSFDKDRVEVVEDDIFEEDPEELNQFEEEDKGDDELRYDPNSVEALQQFVDMQLADWSPEEVDYQILARLYEFPFIPENDGDRDLKTKIIDYRAEFFGFGSQWTSQVTFADVILHFARTAAYHMDEDIRFWVNHILKHNEFYPDMSSFDIDMYLEELNNHTYHNNELDTYGLFGISQEAMTNAIKIADMNIDQSVTYEIEFNEFLKELT